VSSIATLKIGGREYVVMPRKDFERLRRKAELLTDEDAADIQESVRRLSDPREKRVAWEKVKKSAGLT
jgi:hypothetical protein